MLYHHAGSSQADKPLPIQTFASKLAVEAFCRTILAETTGLDKCRAHILISLLAHHCRGGEFCAIVRADVGGSAIQPHGSR